MSTNLTASEIQTIRKMLEGRLADLQLEIKDYKEIVSKTWLKCLKHDESTFKHFERLNSEKDALRNAKRKYVHLAKIQQKLKKHPAVITISA